jgi:hypothetical protein
VTAVEYSLDAIVSGEYCCLECAKARLIKAVQDEYTLAMRLNEERRANERMPIWSIPI